MDLCSQTEGCSGRIHGHVAAAHDDSLLCPHDGSPGFLGEGAHQVGPGQIFIGREDAHGLLAGDVHELGKARAGTYEYGVIALFLHQSIDGGGLADNAVCLDLYAQGLNVLDFLLNDRVLGKTEFGNAVDQNAACLVEGFEDLDIIAHLGQIACAGQTGRTGTDYGDLFALLFCSALGLNAHLAGCISHITLQLAYGNRFALDAADALAFALGFLGTYTSADGRQSGGFADDRIGACHIAFLDFVNKAGNVDGNGAALHAAGILAV